MRALIVVDMQNDFMPDGALPVPEADQIISMVNALMKAFEGDYVVATQDWHPPEHGSFASNNPGAEPGEPGTLDGLEQVMWPDHCVQGTRGAEFVEGLETEHFDEVFRKGTDPLVDSYSGFYDNARRHKTGLGEALRAKRVEEVYVCGVATDYCVKFTVLDALSEGFETYVIDEATRGVNLKPGDANRALEEMAEAGAKVIGAAQVLSSAL